MTMRSLYPASALGLCLVASFWLARDRQPPSAPSAVAPAAGPLTALPPISRTVPPSAPAARPAETASGTFTLTLDDQVFSDPSEAIRFAEDGPADLRLARYLRIIELWGPEDLVAATTWACSLADASERSDVFTRLGQIIRPVAPELAFGLADRLPEGPPRARFLRELVHHWAAENPAAAAADLPRLAHAFPSETQAELQSAIAIEWAQADPRAAADFIATRMPEGRAQADAARTVALRWAFLDPDAAREWIASFPDNSTRTVLLSQTELFATGIGTDPALRNSP